DTLLCRHCGKNRVMVTRYSEGYGTEDGVLSEPQRDSDADADIEDTDCLQEPGTLQRISSRRRKRPQVARQDTTESEDDGGRSHKSHRWNLRLSPDRSHSRTILEESVSQVRPLVISHPNVDGQKNREEESRSSKLKRLWPPALSAPLILLLLLPLSLSVLIVIVSFLLPWARA
uniref:Si:ch211-63p21.1 n=1 Tax=Oryzias latipes TaxID=8090 RepID=A0A3B3I8M4_ORYLA